MVQEMLCLHFKNMGVHVLLHKFNKDWTALVPVEFSPVMYCQINVYIRVVRRTTVAPDGKHHLSIIVYLILCVYRMCILGTSDVCKY